MKMHHRFILSPKSKGRSLEFWIPLLFLAALALFHFFYPAIFGELASRIASPLWRGQRLLRATLRDATSFLASKKDLMSETERLSAELERARALLLDRALLLSENRALKEQFGRRADGGERRIGAILALPPRSPYDTAVIDIGSADGVFAGDLALFGSATLGVVSRTFTRTSLIEFFSTAGKKTAVFILHDGKAVPAEAEGRGGGEFRAMLPKEVSLSPGDPIVIPGQSPLVFAAVEAIEASATDSFEIIRFKNPVSIESLRFLEIQRSGVSN